MSNVLDRSSVFYCRLFGLMERGSCATGLVAVFFSFMYSLSLNLMDLIIPKVIHFDFLCLCLLPLIVLVGKCLLAASVMVNSRMS